MSTPLANTESQGATVGRGRGNGRRGRGQNRAAGGRDGMQNESEGQLEARGIPGQGRGQARARGRGGVSRGGRRPNGDNGPVLEAITNTMNDAGTPQSPAPSDTLVNKQLEQRIEELQRLHLL